MNKLGFAIEIAMAGLRTPLVCNDASWRNRVVDIREYLKLFDGLYHTDNIVTFISFDEGGCLLTQLKAISGKLGDFMSGWIYIPNTIDATGEDVMNAFNYVRNILTMTSIESVKDEIISFFDKEYPQQEYAAAYTPSSGERFGVRYTDVPYTLKEILGSNRFQSYYNGHKAIFILETNGEVNISNDVASMFDDFTKTDIAQAAFLIPPTTAELERLGRGVKLLTENGTEFKSPMIASLKSTIKLFLQKPGFEKIQLTTSVNQEKEYVKLDNIKRQITWIKKISASMFTIACPSVNGKRNIQIWVNGKEITYNDILLEETACRNARVKVSASGYDTWENSKDLTCEPINIVLQKSEMTFEGTIELSNGTYAEITLKSKDLPGGDSPIRGYTSNGDYRKPNLSFSPGYWKQRLIGFASAIILVFVVVLGIAVDSWFDTHEFRLGWPPYKEIKSEAAQEKLDSIPPDSITPEEGDGVADVDSYSLKNAIKYLEVNNTWDKENMEKFPDLQGLFEAMNTYDFPKIKEFAKKLKGSEKLEKIKNAIVRCTRNQGDPKKGKEGKHVDTYNKNDDNSINVNGYGNYVRNCKEEPGTDGANGRVSNGSRSYTKYSVGGVSAESGNENL